MTKKKEGFYNITEDQWDNAAWPRFTEIPSQRNSNYNERSVGLSLVDETSSGQVIENAGIWISHEFRESKFKDIICDIKWRGFGDEEYQICFIQVFLKRTTSLERLEGLLSFIHERLKVYEEKTEDCDDYDYVDDDDRYYF